jgi:hypothetical protein
MRLSSHQGSFFRLQNTEGLTLVGLFMEGTTLTCLETYSDAKKRTLVLTTLNLIEMVEVSDSLWQKAFVTKLKLTLGDFQPLQCADDISMIARDQACPPINTSRSQFRLKLRVVDQNMYTYIFFIINLGLSEPWLLRKGKAKQ